MQLIDLINRLSASFTCTIPFKDELIDVETYSLIEKDQTVFLPNCLYIGTISLLPAVPPEHEANLLCVEDLQRSQLYLDAQHINLCCLAGADLNHYDVLNHVSTIMREEVHTALNMQKLFDASYSNLGLQHLIDVASRIIGHPILLNDTKFMVLALSPGVPDDVTLIENPNGEKYLDASIVTFIKDNNFLGRLRSSPFSYYIKEAKDSNGTLISSIHIQGIEVAQLVVYEAGKPFEETDIRLIEHFGKLLSIELQKNDFFTIGKNLMPNFFLRDLLDKKVNDEESVGIQLQYLNWPKQETYQVMVIASKENDAFESKVPFILQSLQSFISSNRYIVYQTGVVVFMDIQISNSVLEKSNLEFIEYLSVNSLFAGISLPFKKLSESRKYYKQALKASEYAQRNSVNFCLYEKYTLNFLAGHIVAQSDIADFCHPAITKLRDEDRDHGTVFVETLKYYLYYANSPNDAAKALNIHRNTLFYRINKIKQLTGITLENGDERFQIYFSIKLFE